MGNQTTSGIVEEEKATDEASDNALGVSPPEHLAEENQTLIQENAAEADSAGRIAPAERLVSDDKDIEDHKGSDAVIDISANDSSSGEGRSKLGHEEQEKPCTLEDIEEDQNTLVEETLEADDHDAEKNEVDLALADAPSVEGELLEARAHEKELGRDDEPPQEEQSNSSNTVNKSPIIGLLDSSTAENEHKNECLALDHEEKHMTHELGNADTNTTRCIDQEINQSLIRCRSNPTDMIKSEFKENGENLLDDPEKQEDINQNMLEKAVHWESEPSPIENDHEIESETVIELQSSLEIDTHLLFSKTAEAETPPSLPRTESKALIVKELLDNESNPSSIGAQVKLRKSPSFDFGISFDTRSEESDQTPLLYQDRTARRSLSSCSNLRFQNRSVQTEYAGKPLQFEAVQVEEKTIRMERSNSESSHALNNKQGNSNVVTTEPSPSRDVEAAISPKGNSKRKPRSSLFTACICCTAAIS